MILNALVERLKRRSKDDSKGHHLASSKRTGIETAPACRARPGGGRVRAKPVRSSQQRFRTEHGWMRSNARGRLAGALRRVAVGAAGPPASPPYDDRAHARQRPTRAAFPTGRPRSRPRLGRPDCRERLHHVARNRSAPPGRRLPIGTPGFPAVWRDSPHAGETALPRDLRRSRSPGFLTRLRCDPAPALDRPPGARSRQPLHRTALP